jgi:hypothetical protein
VAIVVGVAAYALELASVDIADWLGGSGWTLFVIVPGVLLLLASFLLRDGSALGAIVTGAVITTIGALLLYQDQSAHYESWAYAWALIPTAVGAALAIHGWRFDRPELVTVGTRLAAVFAGVFVFFAWFFETIFRTNEPPFDVGISWPIALVAVGAVLFILGLVRGSTDGGADTAS